MKIYLLWQRCKKVARSKLNGLLTSKSLSALVIKDFLIKLSILPTQEKRQRSSEWRSLIVTFRSHKEVLKKALITMISIWTLRTNLSLTKLRNLWKEAYLTKNKLNLILRKLMSSRIVKLRLWISQLALMQENRLFSQGCHPPKHHIKVVVEMLSLQLSHQAQCLEESQDLIAQKEIKVQQYQELAALAMLYQWRDNQEEVPVPAHSETHSREV